MSSKLAALARTPPDGASLTYRGGAGGARHADCPRCGQAVRVALHGRQLSVHCYGGCAAEELRDLLSVARIVAELARAA